MSDADFSQISENQSIAFYWDIKTLKIWSDALKRYDSIIRPKALLKNTKITEELKAIERMRSSVIKRQNEEGRDWGVIDIHMFAGSYMWLSDLMHKYWSARNQELTEKKSKQTIQGEFEGEEIELEQLREMLTTPVFQSIPRKKILVDSLYISGPETTQQPTQIQYNISNMIGQNVLSSSGISMNQTNNITLIGTMQQLSEEIQSSDLDDSQKSLAVAQIQTIQTQFLGPQPDKSIIEKAFETLNRITLLIQAPETLQKALNYLQAAFTLAKVFHPQIVDGIQLNVV